MRITGILAGIFLLILPISLASGEDLKTTPSEPIVVTWNLYSGRPSPTWKVDDQKQIAKLREMISDLPKAKPPKGWSVAWGGFSFTFEGKNVSVKEGIIQIAIGRAAGTSEFFRDSHGLEQFLFDQAMPWAIQFTIQSDKKVYDEKEKMTVELTFTNVSHKEIYFNSWIFMYPQMLEATVEGPDGVVKKTDFIDYDMKRPDKSDYILLKPGGGFKSGITSSESPPYHFLGHQFKKPGSYTIGITYGNEGNPFNLPNVWTGKIVSNTITIERSYPASAALPPDFEKEFDRHFLSTEPMRYQDNDHLLGLIEPSLLSEQERDLVREKLKAFLLSSEPGEHWIERTFAPDSRHTGIAGELAFLRLDAVDLLGKIGRTKDIPFIEELVHQAAQADFPREHPSFKERCEEAIKNIIFQ